VRSVFLLKNQENLQRVIPNFSQIIRINFYNFAMLTILCKISINIVRILIQLQFKRAGEKPGRVSCILEFFEDPAAKLQ